MCLHLTYLVVWSESEKQSQNVILGFYFKGNKKFCSQDTTAPEADHLQNTPSHPILSYHTTVSKHRTTMHSALCVPKPHR